MGKKSRREYVQAKVKQNPIVEQAVEKSVERSFEKVMSSYKPAEPTRESLGWRKFNCKRPGSFGWRRHTQEGLEVEIFETCYAEDTFCEYAGFDLARRGRDRDLAVRISKLYGAASALFLRGYDAFSNPKFERY